MCSKLIIPVQYPFSLSSRMIAWSASSTECPGCSIQAINSLLNFQKNSRNFVKPITQLSNPSFCLAAATKWAKAKTKAANSCPQRTRKQEQRSVAWKTARTSHRETTRTALPQEDGHVALNAKEQAVFEQAKVLAPCLVLW